MNTPNQSLAIRRGESYDQWMTRIRAQAQPQEPVAPKVDPFVEHFGHKAMLDEEAMKRFQEIFKDV